MSTRLRSRVTRALLWAQVMALLWVRVMALLGARVMALLVRPVPRRKRIDRPEDLWTAMRKDGVVWLAYAFAARHLVHLTAPALIVFLPIGLLAGVALVVLVDGSAAVINDDVVLAGSPGAHLLAWSAAVLAVSTAGQTIALPATMVLAAGRLTGKDVSTSAAMRAAFRRWPATTALALISGVALVTAVGAALLLWPGAQVLAYGLMAVLVLAAMPCLLAVAPLILEGRSVRGALTRAYRLTSGSFFATTLTLLFGVVLFPALATRAAGWASSGVPVAPFAAASVLALVAVPFQAATITRLFLHRMAVKGLTTAFGLPDGAPRPARPVRVLAALMLPTLLYGGAVLINPLGWPEVSETTVTENWQRGPDPDNGRPKLSRRDLRSLQTGPDGHLVMLMDGYGRAKVLTCMDSGCTRTRLTWAEPAKILDHTAAGARLADGRLVLSTWVRERGVSEDDWRARLGLRVCDATGCAAAPGGRHITQVAPYDGHLSSSDRNRTVALTARPGGGLVVAQAHQLPWTEDRVDREAVQITTCDDTSCTRPRTKQVATLPTSASEGQGLLVGVDPAGRPTVLRSDRDTGSISVISCDDPACEDARTTPVQENSYDPALVIRPDGLPLIAYRDTADGAVRLLDCRTRDCSRADTTTVSDPGRTAGPAMVLDRRGRALVAYQDLDRGRILVAACAGGRCTRTAVTPIRRGGDGLAMTLDGRGRPVLAWMDGRPDGWELMLTRLLTPR